MDPVQFVEAVMESFAFGLQQLSEIPQLERLIMPQLFKTASKQARHMHISSIQKT